MGQDHDSTAHSVLKGCKRVAAEEPPRHYYKLESKRAISEAALEGSGES